MYGNFNDTELELIQAKGFQAAYFGDLEAGDVVALPPVVEPQYGVFTYFETEDGLRARENRPSNKPRQPVTYVIVNRVDRDVQSDFDDEGVACNERTVIRFIARDEKGLERHYSELGTKGTYIKTDG